MIPFINDLNKGNAMLKKYVSLLVLVSCGNALAYDVLRPNLKDAPEKFMNRQNHRGSTRFKNSPFLMFSTIIKADFSNADLSESNLFSCDAQSTSFDGANLFRAGFVGSNLYEASFIGARLDYAEMYKAYLSGANLSNASLFRTDLSRADLTGADLSNAILTETILRGACLKGAIGVTLQKLVESKVWMDDSTMLPDGTLYNPNE